MTLLLKLLNLLIILAQMLLRKYAIQRYFIFPPHLTNAAALPGKTGNPEIVSFHSKYAACFLPKTRNTFYNITRYS